MIITAIKERFDQDSYNKYIELEKLLIHAWNGGDFENKLTSDGVLYIHDLTKELLVSQLLILQANKPASVITIFRDVWEHCKKVWKGQDQHYQKSVLVMPATKLFLKGASLLRGE